MPLSLKILLLVVAVAAAALAGSSHARRHVHPRHLHHSIGFVIVAIVAGASLLVFGPR
ncbi:MAG: hypothetical protein QFB89_04290 [Pseudomonadota bacterium]|nr:hypothetical protein [Pseudomonadota bacterium]